VTTEQPKLNIRERITLRKFDGEYAEGAQPAETIVVETLNGEVVGAERIKGENGNGSN
jgi:hypothetical protein